MRGLSSRAQQAAQRVVFPEGEDPRILKAARILADEGIAEPILLGDPDAMRRQADDAGVTRSEEHTSELQSLAYLVCRLLLEKKKKKNIQKNAADIDMLTT